jgi:hypothetical protein
MIQGSENLKILQVFPPCAQLPYGGVLVFLHSSEGKIHITSQSFGLKQRPEYRFIKYLSINSIPLSGYYLHCETCGQLLRAGNYPSDQFHIYLKKIRSLSLEAIAQNQSNWVDDFCPFLNLLEPGFYFLALTPYYPTDGEGRFFWDSFHTLKNSHALQWESVAIPPAVVPQFLLPTQSTRAFNQKRYDKAHSWPGNYPGIAYHIHGSVSALLDGHHRATAAAKNGNSFYCITISSHVWVLEYPLSGRSVQEASAQFASKSEKRLYVPFLGEISSPAVSDLIGAWQKEHKAAEIDKTGEMRKLEDQFTSDDSPRDLTKELGLDISRYPRIEEIVALNVFANPDPDKGLGYYAHRHDLEEKWIDPLIKSENPQKVAALLRIARNNSFRSIWYKIFVYLSAIKSEEIEDLFIHYLQFDSEKRQEFINLIARYLGSEKFDRLTKGSNASWRIQ